MIVVRVELWPGGDGSKAKSLGLATITNDGKGIGKKQNYKVDLYSRGDKPRLLRSGFLSEWNSSAVSAWKTVWEALKTVF